MVRRGHPYPTVLMQARDIVNLRVATLPAGARAEEAHALATRLNAAVLTPIAGLGRFVLREDLSRAVGLGLGELMAHRLGRPLPVVAARASETIVRRHLAGGAPAVIVLDETTGYGAVGRAGFSAVTGPSLTGLLAPTLPPPARALLVRIGALSEAQGGRAFAVGGVVRDILWGASKGAPRHRGIRGAPGSPGPSLISREAQQARKPARVRPMADIDVVVEGDGLTVGRLLAAEIGGALVEHERFLSASVQDATGLRIDIATARIERYEVPAALPRVRPAGIGEDLLRRDFSVNAMAAELSSGAFLLVDPLGGRNDLQRRRLRVLHPLSFVEDPTRIFRAARYGARLDLMPDPWTAACLELAIELAPYRALSGQRILAELELILGEPRAATACVTLGTVGAFRLLDPRYRYTQATAVRLADLDAVRAWTSARSVPASALELLVLALLGDQDPDVSRAALGRLGLSGDGAERLAGALGRWERVGEALRGAPSRSAATRLLRGRPAVELAWVWLRGDPTVRREVARFVDHDARVEPWLRGEEIVALGITRGPEVAQIRESLRDGRLDGTIADRAAAEDYVRRRTDNVERRASRGDSGQGEEG
jgi:tRNA nucleotidyltransferase (CCA-adding enzyme)